MIREMHIFYKMRSIQYTTGEKKLDRYLSWLLLSKKIYISFSDQNFVCGSKFWSLENRLRCVPLALLASFLSLISRRESKETKHYFSATSRNNLWIRSHPLLYIEAESSFLVKTVPPNDLSDWSCAVSALSLLVLTSCDTRRLDSIPWCCHNFCTLN